LDTKIERSQARISFQEKEAALKKEALDAARPVERERTAQEL
jgi:hypothetical protein